MSQKFRVAFTADFFEQGGAPKFREFGQNVFHDAAGFEVSRFDEHFSEITPQQVAEVQAVVVLTPSVTAGTLTRCENLLVLSRFGVGYDNVDVAACTDANVLLTITRGAVDRSVAEAIVGWMIALAHNMLVKDRLLREGRWDERSQFMGSELRDRTLGVIGFGGIGRSLVQLLAGFGMRPALVYDPYCNDVSTICPGARNVTLDELLRESDFVSINCPLNEATRNLLGARELALMKPSAYLINTARGGIVDEQALYAALSSMQIAGAAIDCLVGEPIRSPHPLGELSNVLLAPHSIAWTYEMFRDVGQRACQSILEVAHGRVPHGVVNPEVLDRPEFIKKWERLRTATRGM